MTAPTWRRKRDGSGKTHAHITPWALKSICKTGTLEFTTIDRKPENRCAHCLAALARDPLRCK